MCGDCYLSKTVKGFTIEIGVDEDHESPREDYTLGVLMLHGAAQRRWYASDIGTEDYRKRLDGAIAARQNVARGQADFTRYLRNFERAKVILPVVLQPESYEFAIGTGRQPRGTQWLGYLFDTGATREFCHHLRTAADIEEELRRELAAYSDWQNNPCFQYMVYGPGDDEYDGDPLDGACGFGSAEDAMREAEDTVREELRSLDRIRKEVNRLHPKRRAKTKK